MNFVPYREKLRHFQAGRNTGNGAEKTAAVCCFFAAPSEMEHCVLCGRKTDIPRKRPIDCRTGYVVGCGQLCPDCCRALGWREEEMGSGAFERS